MRGVWAAKATYTCMAASTYSLTQLYKSESPLFRMLSMREPTLQERSTAWDYCSSPGHQLSLRCRSAAVG